eukprot:8092775-Alexandrium_andersonii.AAC.1
MQATSEAAHAGGTGGQACARTNHAGSKRGQRARDARKACLCETCRQQARQRMREARRARMCTWAAL